MSMLLAQARHRAQKFLHVAQRCVVRVGAGGFRWLIGEPAVMRSLPCLGMIDTYLQRVGIQKTVRWHHEVRWRWNALDYPAGEIKARAVARAVVATRPDVIARARRIRR